MKRLTDSEARTLYQYLLKAANPFDIYLLILFETGARVTEALSLDARSLEGNSLTIRGLKGSDDRTLRISTHLLSILQENQWAPKSPMISTTPWRKLLGDGQIQSQRRALCRYFRKLTAKLVSRQLNLHILRHTAFSRLYVATKDLLLVKAWAGHRNIQSTMAYMHVDQREQADFQASALLKNLAS